MFHTIQPAPDRPGPHACARNVTPVSTVRPFILTERPDVSAARIARKRWVLEALRARGESKHDFIASVLGVSRQRVSRCLSLTERDEFSEAQMVKLGIGRAVAA